MLRQRVETSLNGVERWIEDHDYKGYRSYPRRAGAMRPGVTWKGIVTPGIIFTKIGRWTVSRGWTATSLPGTRAIAGATISTTQAAGAEGPNRNPRPFGPGWWARSSWRLTSFSGWGDTWKWSKASATGCSLFPGRKHPRAPALAIRPRGRARFITPT
jgi:hypothetical protein